MGMLGLLPRESERLFGNGPINSFKSTYQKKEYLPEDKETSSGETSESTFAENQFSHLPTLESHKPIPRD